MPITYKPPALRAIFFFSSISIFKSFKLLFSVEDGLIYIKLTNLKIKKNMVLFGVPFYDYKKNGRRLRVEDLNNAINYFNNSTDSVSQAKVNNYKKELKMRATPRQITRWEFAIDVLLMIAPDISKDPVFDRKLVWFRANRFKWSKISRFLGMHRTTLRLRYEKLLDQLSKKIKKEIKFDKLNRILYLI